MSALFFFILSFLFLFFLILKYNNLKNILIISFFLKWTLYFFVFYFNLNFSEGDIRILYWNAIYKSNLSNFYLIEESEIFTSGFYTTVIAFLFKFFSNNSYHLGIFINIILILYSSIYLYKLISLIANEQTSKILCFVFSIYPMLTYLNVLFLRDTIIILCIILSSYFFLKSIRHNSYIDIFYFIIFSFFASALHIGNVLIILMGSIIYSFLFVDNLTYKYFKNNLRFIFYLVILFIFAVILIFILISNIQHFQNFKIPKLGYFNEISLTIFLQKMNIFKESSASQPLFLNINSIYELLYKPFLKFFYFLYAPFVWEIKTARHFFGLIDGFMFILLSLIFIKYVKIIIFKKEILLILFLIIPTLFTYSLFGSNFGTNLRHRVKFIYLMLFISSLGFQEIIIYLKNYFLKFNLKNLKFK